MKDNFDDYLQRKIKMVSDEAVASPLWNKELAWQKIRGNRTSNLWSLERWTIMTISIFLLLIASTFIYMNTNSKSLKNDPIINSVEPITTNIQTVSSISAKSKLPNESSKLSSVINSDSCKKAVDVISQSRKDPKIFSINRHRDTIVVCPEGTQIKIKANSFILKNSSDSLSDKIDFYVEEYYKVSDMLLANLSTSSNGAMLETGGMINISAFSKGKECLLRPNSRIDIAFPVKKKRDGMELFSGEWTDQSINWNLEKQPTMETEVISSQTSELKKDIYQPFLIVEQMPIFPGGMDGMNLFIDEISRYPKKALEQKLEGKVYVQFVIDEKGFVIKPRVVRGLSNVLDTVACYIVSQMPRWLPGRQGGKVVPVSYTIPINFLLSKYENAIMSETELMEFESAKSREFNFKEGSYNDSLNKQSNLANSMLDKVSLDVQSNYILRSYKLGWINCDAFYRSSQPLVKLIVETKEGDNLNVRIVFHSIKSIIDGVVNKNICSFSNVPLGEKITIVALCTRNGKRFLSVKESIIEKQKEILDDFKPVTFQILQEEMIKLDILFR